MDAVLSETERIRMMGHNPGSDQFVASWFYFFHVLLLIIPEGLSISLGQHRPWCNSRRTARGRRRQHLFNEGWFNHPGSRAAHSRLLQAVSGMAKDRDPDAPVSLNAAEMNDLLSDPELVGFREEKVQAGSLPLGVVLSDRHTDQEADCCSHNGVENFPGRRSNSKRELKNQRSSRADPESHSPAQRYRGPRDVPPCCP